MSLIFTTRGCLLDQTYKFNGWKRVLPFSSHIGAYLIGLTIQAAKSESYPFFIIHRCLLDQAYKSDGRKWVLPFITWSYARLPVKLILIHLPGLTSKCRFGCVFDFVTHIYLFRLTTLMPSCQGSNHLAGLITFIFSSWKVLLYFNNSFLTFIFLTLYMLSPIPLLAFSLPQFCRLSFFLIFSKMQNANVMPQLCRWNIMIGLTNAIYNHYAPACHW